MTRTRLLIALGLILVALVLLPRSAIDPARSTRSAGVPRLDHVVVIVMENKTYDEARTPSYTASLIAGGTSFAQSFAIGHPSQPNYLALWSGSTMGVSSDRTPAPGSPFTSENLGHACETAGLTWAAYAENLPLAGSPVGKAGLYVRKHAPWTNWSNLDHANERPFTDLDSVEAAGALPNLVFIIPNQHDDTHDAGSTAADGDRWLAAHVPALLRAVGPRGLVILTWDEADISPTNRILTVFAGAPVKRGYVSTRYVSHYSVLRTITGALGLPAFGAAAVDSAITDAWAVPVPRE
jgi:phosphatidylinositol-3-phosphatase